MASDDKEPGSCILLSAWKMKYVIKCLTEELNKSQSIPRKTNTRKSAARTKLKLVKEKKDVTYEHGSIATLEARVLEEAAFQATAHCWSALSNQVSALAYLSHKYRVQVFKFGAMSLAHSSEDNTFLNHFARVMTSISSHHTLSSVILDHTTHLLATGDNVAANELLETHAKAISSQALPSVQAYYNGYRAIIQYLQLIEKKQELAGTQGLIGNQVAATNLDKVMEVKAQKVLEFTKGMLSIGCCGNYDMFISVAKELLVYYGKMEAVEELLLDYLQLNSLQPSPYLFLHEFYSQYYSDDTKRILENLKELLKITSCEKKLMDICDLLNEDVSGKLDVLLSLADHHEWQSSEAVWERLAKTLIFEAEMCNDFKQKSRMASLFHDRITWWDSYHFGLESVHTEAENVSQMRIYKAIVATVMYGTEHVFVSSLDWTESVIFPDGISVRRAIAISQSIHETLEHFRKKCVQTTSQPMNLMPEERTRTSRSPRSEDGASEEEDDYTLIQGCLNSTPRMSMTTKTSEASRMHNLDSEDSSDDQLSSGGETSHGSVGLESSTRDAIFKRSVSFSRNSNTVDTNNESKSDDVEDMWPSDECLYKRSQYSDKYKTRSHDSSKLGNGKFSFVSLVARDSGGHCSTIDGKSKKSTMEQREFSKGSERVSVESIDQSASTVRTSLNSTRDDQSKVNTAKKVSQLDFAQPILPLGVSDRPESTNKEKFVCLTSQQLNSTKGLSYSPIKLSKSTTEVYPRRRPPTIRPKSYSDGNSLMDSSSGKQTGTAVDNPIDSSVGDLPESGTSGPSGQMAASSDEVLKLFLEDPYKLVSTQSKMTSTLDILRLRRNLEPSYDLIESSATVNNRNVPKDGNSQSSADFLAESTSLKTHRPTASSNHPLASNFDELDLSGICNNVTGPSTVYRNACQIQGIDCGIQGTGCGTNPSYAFTSTQKKGVPRAPSGMEDADDSDSLNQDLNLASSGSDLELSGSENESVGESFPGFVTGLQSVVPVDSEDKSQSSTFRSSESEVSSLKNVPIVRSGRKIAKAVPLDTFVTSKSKHRKISKKASNDERTCDSESTEKSIDRVTDRRKTMDINEENEQMLQTTIMHIKSKCGLETEHDGSNPTCNSEKQASSTSCKKKKLHRRTAEIEAENFQEVRLNLEDENLEKNVQTTKKKKSRSKKKIVIESETHKKKNRLSQLDRLNDPESEPSNIVKKISKEKDTIQNQKRFKEKKQLNEKRNNLFEDRDEECEVQQQEVLGKRKANKKGTHLTKNIKEGLPNSDLSDPCNHSSPTSESNESKLKEKKKRKSNDDVQTGILRLDEELCSDITGIFKASPPARGEGKRRKTKKYPYGPTDCQKNGSPVKYIGSCSDIQSKPSTSHLADRESEEGHDGSNLAGKTKIRKKKRSHEVSTKTMSGDESRAASDYVLEALCSEGNKKSLKRTNKKKDKRNRKVVSVDLPHSPHVNLPEIVRSLHGIDIMIRGTDSTSADDCENPRATGNEQWESSVGKKSKKTKKESKKIRKRKMEFSQAIDQNEDEEIVQRSSPHSNESDGDCVPSHEAGKRTKKSKQDSKKPRHSQSKKSKIRKTVKPKLYKGNTSLDAELGADSISVPCDIGISNLDQQPVSPKTDNSFDTITKTIRKTKGVKTNKIGQSTPNVLNEKKKKSRTRDKSLLTHSQIIDEDCKASIGTSRLDKKKKRSAKHSKKHSERSSTTKAISSMHHISKKKSSRSSHKKRTGDQISKKIKKTKRH